MIIGGNKGEIPLLQCYTTRTIKATGSARISDPTRCLPRVLASNSTLRGMAECHVALCGTTADLIFRNSVSVTLHLHDLEMSFRYDPKDQRHEAHIRVAPPAFASVGHACGSGGWRGIGNLPSAQNIIDPALCTAGLGCLGAYRRLDQLFARVSFGYERYGFAAVG